MNEMKILGVLLNCGFLVGRLFSAEVETVDSKDGTVVFEVREIPEGVPKLGHGKDARMYGYRIPSLLTTKEGTVLAFCERRLGLHDHAQNDLVVRRSADGGQSWGKEIVVFEDGMNSINDPLTVQLADGRVMMMFARFPYGRHARNAGWIKMAENGYDDPKVNVLTFVTFSDDDGKTWSKPKDISKSVKPEHWINANSPGAMIQIRRGQNKGRIVNGLWGTVPDAERKGRTWEIVVVYSDDLGTTWNRSDPLKDPEKGFPNECQIAEAANGDLVLISRNQGGEAKRKKSISQDGGLTWSVIKTDESLPSVACMGSIVKGPKRGEGWDLYASFPSAKGRKDGQIAISKDFGKSFEIQKIVKGDFAYSATQVSPDGKSLLCFYETDGYKTIRLLEIPFEEIEK
jgi:sialidase-1|tara:strand:- start:6562 stop:7764 length:1203 start_codon:yes stop_codon:yes gene_type:complete